MFVIPAQTGIYFSTNTFEGKLQQEPRAFE